VWLNRLLIASIVAAVWITTGRTQPEPSHPACPLLHHGMPLLAVRLFDGLPSEHAELIPRDGGWDLDEPGSRVLPNFTLRCLYRGSKEMVTVVLPRGVRVCEFRNYPKVSCH
jgi:hypothetical protein